MSTFFVQTTEFNRFRDKMLRKVCFLSKDIVEINAQSVDSYDLIIEDEGAIILMESSNPNTVNVPLNSNINFPIGTQVTIIQYGTGQTSIAPALGVTVNSAGGLLNIGAQYAGASLIKVAVDEWLLIGNLA